MPHPSLDVAGNYSVASWPLGPSAREAPGRPPLNSPLAALCPRRWRVGTVASSLMPVSTDPAQRASMVLACERCHQAGLVLL